MLDEHPEVSIAASEDVVLSSPQNKQVLSYQSSTAKWVNASSSSSAIWSTPGEFGALGNGIADDAPAIQAAIDSGKPVMIPAGNYRCATLPLRLRQGTRLCIDPAARLIRAASGNFMVNTPGAIGAATAGGYTGVGNVRIEGGIWDFKANDFSTTACNGIVIGHARNIIITGAIFRDVPGYHAVELHGVEQARIWGCRFEGFRDTGSRDYSDAIQLDTARGGFTPADGTACYDVDVSACWFGNSSTTGTVAWPVGVGSHTALWGSRHRDIRVHSNSFVGCRLWAIHSYVWSETVLSNNTIYGTAPSPTGGGIYVRSLNMSVSSARLDVDGVSHTDGQPTNDVVVTGNTVRNVTSGIVIEGDSTTPGGVYSATIANNIVRSTTSNGIWLKYTQRYAGSGNILSDIGGTNIVIENSTAFSPATLS